MDITAVKELLKKTDGLSKTLSMEFISTPEDDTLQAKMPVNDKNKQVFGFLSGGASLALAENLAGVGSMAICPGYMALGINVSGNHVKSVLVGGVVTAFGKIVHQGKTLHVWHVDIKNEQQDLISTVQVTNYMIPANKD